MNDSRELLVTYWPDDSENELVVDLKDWPAHDSDDTRLREAFAEAVRHCTGPLGTWRTTESCITYLKVTKRFVKWLASNEVVSVRQLTPGVWNDYAIHLASDGRKESTANGVRLQLRQSLTALPGVSDSFLNAVARRIGTNKTGNAKLRYTREEFTAIKAAARRVVRDAHARITTNWTLMIVSDADAASLTGEEQIRRDALRLLFTEGRVVNQRHCKQLVDQWNARPKAVSQLWLTSQEAHAAGVWLATLTGENKAVIIRKTLPSSAASLGDKEAIAFTRDWKLKRPPGRRFQPSPWRDEKGEDSVGKALRVIADVCAPARVYLGARNLPADRLIYYRPVSSGPRRNTNADHTLPQPGLPSADGMTKTDASWWPWSRAEGPGLSFIALRNTYETATWRINPNSFGGGHDSNQQLEYRRGDPAQVEMAHEHAVEAMQAASDQADQYTIWQPGVETPRNKDMVGVSCDDWTHNPRTNAPCGEHFLTCFDCPNGCITPRHLPVDVLILDGLENLRATIPPKRWANRYARHYGHVLSALNMAGVDQRRRVFLRGQATEAQRERVQRAFRGDYDADHQSGEAT